MRNGSLSLLFCLAYGCYGSESEGEPEPRGPFDDVDGDGAPDEIGNDPVLDHDWSPDDHDLDGLPNDDDLDDDNDGILDDAPPPDLVTVVRPIAAADCEAVASCCEAGWSAGALENCTIQTTGRLVLAVSQGWSEGFVVVDPGGLESCLAAQGFSCATPDTRTLPYGCSEYLIGTRSVRETCYRSIECEPAAYCETERQLAQLRLGPGPYQATVSMAPGMFQLMTCLADAQVGEVCGPQGGECAQGLHCQRSDAGDACVVTAGAGAGCTVAGTSERADDCGSGLYCDDNADIPLCMPEGDALASCRENRECLSGECDVRTEQCEPPVFPFDYCGEGSAFDAG